MTLINEINKKTDELLAMLDEAGIRSSDLANLAAIIDELLETVSES